MEIKMEKYQISIRLEAICIEVDLILRLSRFNVF